MKENNLNRVIGWSGLLLTSLLSTSALADNIGTSAEELGLSDYRHFVIYPRLDKALKAQKNNDEATAIREFEYIHQQVPDNIPLTLYLAEAYRHFGHDDRARLLLEDQLKRHPGDARLERSLAAILVEVKSVTTVEELLAQQKACDAAPTLRCRSEVGQNALRLAQLPVARAQLNDATFAASPEGKTLRTDLLQRAIYLKQWSQADTLYNEARQQNTLSAAERRQWFDVLLAGQLDDRILALQSQGIFTDPQSYITYATALAYRGEKARLQHYLIENKPLFTTDAQEKSWLYLLSKYSANPVQALANYTVQFADNRQYVVGATLPVLLKEGQYDAAQKLLATLPANEMLEERYAVSVATRNKAESLRLARLLYQQEPANLTRLDQLTWQLMQNEQSREAADLLLQRYPFQGDARVSQTLMARLASLLESHPYLATPAKVAILSKPLPLAAQRQWQSQLPGIADNCPAIVRLLGDMSPSYDAAAWNRLAKCYRDTLPGVALYAWLQAEQRQPNAWQHRAVAYQAYQVEDYATALAAWQKISLHDNFHALFLQRSTVITVSHHDADGACPGGLRDQTPGGGAGKQLPCTAVHVIGQRPYRLYVTHTGDDVSAVKCPCHHSAGRVHIEQNAVHHRVPGSLLQTGDNAVVTGHSRIRLQRPRPADQRAGHRQHGDAVHDLITAGLSWSVIITG